MEQAPQNLEVVNGRGFFRPVGHVSLQGAIEIIESALVYARVHGIKELLFNGRGLTGFDSPTLSERFFLAERCAAAAGGAVRLAMVIHAEMIDPEKFGTTVANNRGLASDVFDHEAEAIAWLDRLDSQAAIPPQTATRPE